MAKGTRKAKIYHPSTKRSSYIPSLVDEIDAEIDFALGIEAAVRGLEESDDDSRGGVRELVFVHIDRLRAISAQATKQAATSTPRAR